MEKTVKNNPPMAGSPSQLWGNNGAARTGWGSDNIFFPIWELS